ncbi:MAG: hypothetical protein K8I30_00355, partial [Anaerolineae bacterium]|nr:hypothetical protein [Anaerolineae bacterium]
TKLAFVCSWNGPEGIPDGAGNLCVVDVSGRNLSIWDWMHPNIFPPAWPNSNDIFYGGSAFDSECANTLCRVDAQGAWSRPLDEDLPTGADMPRVSDGTLMYRHDGGFRLAELCWWRNDLSGNQDLVSDFTSFPSDPHTARPQCLHTDVYYYDSDVDDYFPLSDDADFLELPVGHRGLAILFYETGGYNWIRVYMETPNYFGGNEYPYWSNPNGSQYWIHNMWSNLPTGDPWYEALRNSVDWVF